jgi:hypothetical protein
MEVSLRPRSVTIELGVVSVWTAYVRRRQGKGAPGRNGAQKAWFLAAPENPAQPNKNSFEGVLKAQNVISSLRGDSFGGHRFYIFWSLESLQSRLASKILTHSMQQGNFTHYRNP